MTNLQVWIYNNNLYSKSTFSHYGFKEVEIYEPKILANFWFLFHDMIKNSNIRYAAKEIFSQLPKVEIQNYCQIC